ncbi:MAG: RluA family pseudouridine synthase, partial [Planctomycetes bacterium]|nr:RluA family pseudouridine synthase [Planctomycetota bacterium]
ARQAISAGLVCLDGNVIMSPTEKLEDQDYEITLDLRQGLKKATKKSNERPFEIIFQDEDIVVVNKAADILSAPSQRTDHGHVPELLRNYWRSKKENVPYIGVVHRIDQATSGCLLFALNKNAQNIMNIQFQNHVAERRYKCLVLGTPKQDRDTLEGQIGRGYDGKRAVVKEDENGKSAVTHFQVTDKYAMASALDVQLQTGRTHQIRVHLTAIGCPILGDGLYSAYALKHGKLRGLPRCSRLMLHAYQLNFDHPVSGDRMTVEAPIPKAYSYMQEMLGRQKENKNK